MPESTDAADTTDDRASRSAWSWVPSLYFAEGIPYVVVMTLAVVMYKRMGISNTEIALYTSWLYLPWVIKPLWSPIVDSIRTKRFWIVVMQLLIGAGFAGIALTLPGPHFLRWSLAVFWLLAFSSATHDIAADGFYLLGLSTHQQAWFVGVRSTFYRLAMIAGQGLLIMFAGGVESWTGLPVTTVSVNAAADGPELPDIAPDALVFRGTTESPGILSMSEAVPIGLQPVAAAEARDRIRQVQAWNVKHGFYRVPADSATTSAERPRWLVALEDLIRRHFGEAEQRRDEQQMAGNVAVVPFRLSQPLHGNESIIVQIGRTRGNASISIVEGDRFELNADNSHLPFLTAIQLDWRLAAPATTEFATRSGNISLAWTLTFYLLAALFVIVAFYHLRVLPKPASDQPASSTAGFAAGEMLESITSFFRKPHIVVIILFLLLYRFAEAQLVKMAAPFLLDARDVGGLGLTTAWVGFLYGTVGVVLLSIGGLLGGFVAARHGLRAWLVWMVLAINVPNAVYTLMAYFQPREYWLIGAAVGLEQLGYGFGFTAYLLYCMYVSQGRHETVHYALCTGFMALGMMVPGMLSGWLQELIGYRHFFLWVLVATIPSFIVTYLIPLESGFGRERSE